MKTPITRHVTKAAALLVCACALAACVTEGPTGRPPKQEIPWPQKDAPADLDLLAEDLMAFQGMSGSLPLTLKQLDQAHLGTAKTPYAARGFAYHPSGVGVLRDGWCVLAVNDRIRPGEEGHAWTILRPPVRVRGTPSLQVAKVSLAELEQAAQMAKKNGGGAGAP